LEGGLGKVEVGQDSINIINWSWGTGQSIYMGSTENVCGISRPVDSGRLNFDVWNGSSILNGMYLSSTELYVNGDIDASGTKNFNIQHPLSSLAATHRLRHAAVEGPRSDLLYRGKVTMASSSTVTVDMDTAAGLTSGTFVLLVGGEVQVFTSNESGWCAVRGSIDGATLTIETKKDCSDTISWMVVGERIDPDIIASPHTNPDGTYIPEYVPLPEPSPPE
jgi:hypothetical protein